MTDPLEPPRDAEPSDRSAPGAADAYDAMEPLEPYTTGELATVLDAPTRVVRKLLRRLAGEGKVRRKVPEAGARARAGRAVWIRDPPKYECPQCGSEFEVRYFHPVFQAVQFCPRCGTRLRKRARR